MIASKTKSERQKRFLEGGFFPGEMPPPFVSKDIAIHRVAIEKVFEVLPKVKGEKWYYRFVTISEIILFLRPQRMGRQFTILNPISYFYLVRELANHWVEIKKHVKKSKCSASNLVFDWDGQRTFLRPNFEAQARRIRELSLQNPFLLHSDVSRFYHSIYTHAIPWALHTTRSVCRELPLARLSANGMSGLARRLPETRPAASQPSTTFKPTHYQPACQLDFA